MTESSKKTTAVAALSLVNSGESVSPQPHAMRCRRDRRTVQRKLEGLTGPPRSLSVVAFSFCAALTLAACAGSEPVVDESGTERRRLRPAPAGRLGRAEAGALARVVSSERAEPPAREAAPPPGRAFTGTGGVTETGGSTGTGGDAGKGGGAGTGGTTGGGGVAGTGGLAGRVCITGTLGGGATGLGGRGGTIGSGGGGSPRPGRRERREHGHRRDIGNLHHGSGPERQDVSLLVGPIRNGREPAVDHPRSSRPKEYLITYGSSAAFSATWNNSGDFLARVGLSLNSNKGSRPVRDVGVDFAETKSGNGGGLLVHRRLRMVGRASSSSSTSPRISYNGLGSSMTARRGPSPSTEKAPTPSTNTSRTASRRSRTSATFRCSSSASAPHPAPAGASSLTKHFDAWKGLA